jgi:hypothetical protein
LEETDAMLAIVIADMKDSSAVLLWVLGSLIVCLGVWQNNTELRVYAMLCPYLSASKVPADIRNRIAVQATSEWKDFAVSGA